MFRKSKHKDSKAYINFINYQNLYNKLKKLHKQNYYATKFKNDSKRTWKILKEIIGKQNDNISEVFRSGNDVIEDPKTISNMFCK